VKIGLDNKDHLLKPGMFAEVILHWTDPPSLLIPREAVVAADGGSKVFVLENGVARERKIETGKSDDKNIAVLSGLKQDEEVMIKGLNSLKDGVKVNVQPK
jgi:cobalt-zinc-cadmium efflux system membrane fusion protein